MEIKKPINYIDGTKNRQSFKRIPNKPLYIPDKVGDAAKVLGEYINAPEQKLFLATTALMFQPLIDLKFAEDDKKVDSAIKSASKAIAGGITGVTIRSLFMALTKKYIVYNEQNKNFLNRFFFPSKISFLFEKKPDIAQMELDKYNKTLGVIFATFFMIFFSNSKVDVPLTSDLQDIISGVVKDKKSCIRSITDVTKQRGTKIKNWFQNGYDKGKDIVSKAVQIFNIIKPEDKEIDKQ